MEYIKNDAAGWTLLLLALGMLSFTVRFHKVTLIEDGENVSPKWFRPFGFLGAALSLALLLSQLSVLGRFLVHVVFRIRQAPANLAAALLVLLIAALVFLASGRLGILLRERLLAPSADAFFDRDEVVQKLLRDVENGAAELRIYQNRLEGLRSFPFDIDGYNHPAYSASGCKEMAAYISRRFPDRFTVRICMGSAGEGSQSGVNVVNNGPRYRFSHIVMKRK